MMDKYSFDVIGIGLKPLWLAQNHFTEWNNNRLPQEEGTLSEYQVFQKNSSSPVTSIHLSVNATEERLPRPCDLSRPKARSSLRMSTSVSRCVAASHSTLAGLTATEAECQLRFA